MLASPGTCLRSRKSVLRASYGIYYGRQNMLSQVGSITDNGAAAVRYRVWLERSDAAAARCPFGNPTSVTVAASGGNSGVVASIRVFQQGLPNPRIYTANAQFEQEVAHQCVVLFRLLTRKACT